MPNFGNDAYDAVVELCDVTRRRLHPLKQAFTRRADRVRDLPHFAVQPEVRRSPFTKVGWSDAVHAGIVL